MSCTHIPLGCSLHIILAILGHRMQVIVQLGRAFELCNIKDHHFYWFLNLLRVSLMWLCKRYRLHYQRLFWVHYPDVYMEELYIVTYQLFALASRVNLFLIYLPKTRLTRVETSYHLVAPPFEARIRYLNFGDISKIGEFDGWQVMPTTAANLDHEAISSYEDN